MLDSVRVTVLGGGKRKVVTRDRRGTTTERYDVRWRVHLRSGGTRMFRQRFDRAADADHFVRRLNAVGLAGSTWILDDNGRPHDGPVTAAQTSDTSTVWEGLLVYRATTWRTASGNGRKSAVITLRAMGALLRPGAPSMHDATKAYLHLVAFRMRTRTGCVGAARGELGSRRASLQRPRPSRRQALSREVIAPPRPTRPVPRQRPDRGTRHGEGTVD